MDCHTDAGYASYSCFETDGDAIVKWKVSGGDVDILLVDDDELPIIEYTMSIDEFATMVRDMLVIMSCELSEEDE